MKLILKGVRQNNLKNINVELPKNKMTVVTGISGSGKSSLVFDVIYAEAQRQLLESMSTFSRISIPRYSRPNVDNIKGLSPTFIIDQKQISNNPRSTVGTFFEVYSYIRLLYSRFGNPHMEAGSFSFNNPEGACEKCKGTGKEINVNLDKLLNYRLSLNQGAVRHRRYKNESREWNILKASQFFDMDKKLVDYTHEELDMLLYSDSIKFTNNTMGFVQGFNFEGIVKRILGRATDSRGLSGVNYDSLFTYESNCSRCKGSRINEAARTVMYHNKSIVELVTMEVSDLLLFLDEIYNDTNEVMAKDILDYIIRMLKVLVDLGLGYITLSRPIGSLSNGEAKRIKLARQLGTSLSDLIYIIDEPTSGLHAKDCEKIIDIIKGLVVNSNTVIVVEHNLEVIKNADYILELGPLAGEKGGEVVFSGSYGQLIKSDTLTSKAIAGRSKANKRIRQTSNYVDIKANRHNIHNENIRLPMGVFTCITGVSGSGKTSLLQEIERQIEDCIVISQSKIGVSNRSNAVTYIDAFSDIRKEFAKHTGQDMGLFAFNSKGACNKCKGSGQVNVNMHFLGDINTVCSVCNGRRYTDEVLNFKYKNKSIADVLDMTVNEAVLFFENPTIINKLDILNKVGLGYLSLGQSLDTLSGGEAQRVRLANGLSKKGTVFLLDEPSRGLHMKDIENLLELFDTIIEQSNSIVVVEHNMEIIRYSDYIIDMGPGAGKLGGTVVAAGTPEEVKLNLASHTAKYL